MLFTLRVNSISDMSMTRTNLQTNTH